MDNATKVYREKAMAYIKAMGKGYALEKKTPQWAAWEAYFLRTMGKLPLEMTNLLRGYTKAVTVPAELPEDFDAGYIPGSVDERTERQRRYVAARLCNCPMGDLAHREGWLRALIEFAEKHDRLPVGQEIEGVRAVGERAKQALQKAEGTIFYSNLLRLRQMMNASAFREVFRGEPPVIQEAAE